MTYAIRNFAGNDRPAAAADPVSRELAGMRVQLMRALDYIHHGAKLVYRLQLDPVESEAQRMLGSYLVSGRNWLGGKIEPLYVPGTLCPHMIGEALMRFDWVKPADEDDSTGYLRRFVLSETGERALQLSLEWWRSLSWFQRAWLSVME